MGLDIYFFRIKREGYEEFKEKYDKADKAFSAYFNKLYKHYGALVDDVATEKEKAKLNELRNSIPNKGEFEEDAGYFRKVNFLIPFFDYEEDCSEQDISVAQLKELVRRCKIVLEERNEETSKEELPTTSGFFFGSTDYGEDYYDDVAEVKEWAEELIATTNEDTHRLVMYCWW